VDFLKRDAVIRELRDLLLEAVQRVPVRASEGGSMSYRTSAGQTTHDRVIADVAAAQNRHQVLTNPGHEHKWSIQTGQETVFPDLLLCKPGTRTVVHLIEVETEDSVNEAESDQ
jgi:hypothetical protein